MSSFTIPSYTRKTLLKLIKSFCIQPTEASKFKDSDLDALVCPVFSKVVTTIKNTERAAAIVDREIRMARDVPLHPAVLRLLHGLHAILVATDDYSARPALRQIYALNIPEAEEDSSSDSSSSSDDESDKEEEEEERPKRKRQRVSKALCPWLPKNDACLVPIDELKFRKWLADHVEVSAKGAQAAIQDIACRVNALTAEKSLDALFGSLMNYCKIMGTKNPIYRLIYDELDESEEAWDVVTLLEDCGALLDDAMPDMVAAEALRHPDLKD